MARPCFVVDNLLSSTQYRDHVVTASSAAARCEPWRVADGRRSVLDRWTPLALDTEAWIQVSCGTARTADLLVLDRGHNLAGHQVQLQTSDGGEEDPWTTILDVTIPAAVTEPGDLDAAAGVHTEEGAWIKRFAAVEAAAWRVVIPGMGAGLRPEIVGLWLGESWTPRSYLDLPYDDQSYQLSYTSIASDAAWEGRGRTSRRRAGSFRLRLMSADEHDLARRHVRDGYWRPRPMWIVFDAAAAATAVLAMPPAGTYGWVQQAGWSHRQAEIAWAEHEPRAD